MSAALRTSASSQSSTASATNVAARRALGALTRAVAAKDSSIQQHLDRVAEIPERLAVRGGWNFNCVYADYARPRCCATSARFGVPDAILFKPCRLTRRRVRLGRGARTRRRDHRRRGTRPRTVRWVGSHLDRPDGQRYADGVSGEHIPDGARLLRVGDATHSIKAHALRPGRRRRQGRSRRFAGIAAQSSIGGRLCAGVTPRYAQRSRGINMQLAEPRRVSGLGKPPGSVIVVVAIAAGYSGASRDEATRTVLWAPWAPTHGRRNDLTARAHRSGSDPGCPLTSDCCTVRVVCCLGCDVSTPPVAPRARRLADSRLPRRLLGLTRKARAARRRPRTFGVPLDRNVAVCLRSLSSPVRRFRVISSRPPLYRPAC